MVQLFHQWWQVPRGSVDRLRDTVWQGKLTGTVIQNDDDGSPVKYDCERKRAIALCFKLVSFIYQCPSVELQRGSEALSVMVVVIVFVCVHGDQVHAQRQLRSTSLYCILQCGTSLHAFQCFVRQYNQNVRKCVRIALCWFNCGPSP